MKRAFRETNDALPSPRLPDYSPLRPCKIAFLNIKMPPIDRKKIRDAKVDEAHKALFDEAIAIRRSVAGDS